MPPRRKRPCRDGVSEIVEFFEDGTARIAVEASEGPKGNTRSIPDRDETV